MSGVTVVLADYTADSGDSYLAALGGISEARRDGGLLHGGHIHYIQSNFDGLVLKAAIKGILDRVPDPIPSDLPKQVREADDYEPPEAVMEAVLEVNEGLIMPVQGWEVVRIIELADEYAALNPENAS